MNTLVKVSFFLLAFFAVNLTVQGQNCQAATSCCSKKMTKVENQEVNQATAEKASATLVENVQQTTDRASVPVQLSNLTTQAQSGAKANCQPKNCQPTNCDPANCDLTQCDPANCKLKSAKKAKQL